MPCADIADASQRQADGSLFWRTIPGRLTGRIADACVSQLRELLKAMVRKGVALGLDGLCDAPLRSCVDARIVKPTPGPTCGNA